jgi:hypothetical protein
VLEYGICWRLYAWDKVTESGDRNVRVVRRSRWLHQSQCEFSVYKSRTTLVWDQDGLTLVEWPFLPDTPWYCHLPFNWGCFVYYGNWGGPGYSGGQYRPLEKLTAQEKRYLLKPIDAQDTCYMEHDYCYSDDRARNNGQQTAAGSCDFQLQQCLHLINSAGNGNAHSWTAEPLFSVCEMTRVPCHLTP